MNPAVEIRAAFDSEMKFCLRPVIFMKLLKIGDLVAEPPKPEEYYIKKMRKKVKMAQFTGHVRVQNKLNYWDVGTCCIVNDRLYFFETDDPSDYRKFNLNGCYNEGGLTTEDFDVHLKNRFHSEMTIRLRSSEQAERWYSQLQIAIEKIRKED